MATLPAADVTAAPASDREPGAPWGSVDLVISRGGKARSYRCDGQTVAEVVQDAVRKVLDDPHTAEHIRRR